MKLKSSAFEAGSSIPTLYTCDGKNIMPPLEVIDIPVKCKSIVLIMDDPDVPKNIRPDGVWDHLLVWNIDPKVGKIGNESEMGGVLGLNTGGKRGYGGPCPPDREHRYFFKAYALDTKLDLDKDTNKNELIKSFKGHILENAELMGRYNRKKNNGGT